MQQGRSKMKVTENYNFAVIYPETAKHWDYNKNKSKPQSFPPRSHLMVHWKCPECGIESFSRIDDKVRSTQSHQCHNCLSIEKYKQIAEFYKQGNSLSQTRLKFKTQNENIKKALDHFNIEVRPSEYYNDKLTQHKLTLQELKDETKKEIIEKYATTNTSINELTDEYNLTKSSAQQLLLGVDRILYTKNQYQAIKLPNHPRADSTGLVAIHTLTAEHKLGRPISNKEQIHHIDLDKNNNHPNNLAVGSPQNHGFWHKTMYQFLGIVLPLLLKSGIVFFTEEHGYGVDIKLLGKFEKKFILSKRQKRILH